MLLRPTFMGLTRLPSIFCVCSFRFVNLEMPDVAIHFHIWSYVPIGNRWFPFDLQLSSHNLRKFWLQNTLVVDSNTMSEQPVPKFEENPNPGVSVPPQTRNRWKRSQRPPGKDHSLGFPSAQRGCDSESSSSEVILFQSPIIGV